MENKDVNGVSGWLWFFAFSLAVLYPLLRLSNILSFNNGIILLVYYSTLFAFSIFAGVSIFKKKDNAIIYAKEFLITIIVLSLIDLIDVFLSYNYAYKILAPIYGVTAIYHFIWLLYLNNSKRVENTFKKRNLNWKRIFVIIAIVIVFELIINFGKYLF